jgi:hypothetical protein
MSKQILIRYFNCSFVYREDQMAGMVETSGLRGTPVLQPRVKTQGGGIFFQGMVAGGRIRQGTSSAKDQ